MNIGKGIRKALIDADKTQTWLANKLDMTAQGVNYLCKQKSIALSTIIKISVALGIPAVELIKMGED